MSHLYDRTSTPHPARTAPPSPARGEGKSSGEPEGKKGSCDNADARSDASAIARSVSSHSAAPSPTPPSPLAGEGAERSEADEGSAQDAAALISVPGPSHSAAPSPTSPSPLAGEGAERSEADEGAAPIVRARSLRRRMTEAEVRLWRLLRARRFAGFKFRRQVPLGPYIADFACLAARLVVEADGSQHADSAYDQHRDLWLKARGYRVLRFWNNDILTRSSDIKETIWSTLHQVPKP